MFAVTVTRHTQCPLLLYEYMTHKKVIKRIFALTNEEWVDESIEQIIFRCHHHLSCTSRHPTEQASFIQTNHSLIFCCCCFSLFPVFLKGWTLSIKENFLILHFLVQEVISYWCRYPSVPWRIWFLAHLECFCFLVWPILERLRINV